jgi:hypothetical protein
MRRLERDLKRMLGPGVRIVHARRGGHLRIVLQDGQTVVASKTPSCPHALRKVRADVRRARRRRPRRLPPA